MIDTNFTVCSVCSHCLESEDLILQLNNDRIQSSIPVLCFISLVILLGTAGNLLVLATYFKQLHKNSTNFFIFCLASFDLISCVISLPVEIFGLLNPLTNDKPWLCKLYRWEAFSADLASGFTIVCISFDRYLRIARPYKGFSRRTSRRAVVVVVFTSLLVCSMSLFVYGTEPVRMLEHPELTGCQCGTDPMAKETPIPLLFSTTILVAFVIGVFILLVVYLRLGILVRRWNKGRIKSAGNKWHRKTIGTSDDSSSKSDKTLSRSQSETAKCQVPLLNKDIARVKINSRNDVDKSVISYFRPPDNLNRTSKIEIEQVMPEVKCSVKQTCLTDTNISEVDNKSVESLPIIRPGLVKDLTSSLERNGFSVPDPSVHFDGTTTLPLKKMSSKQRSKKKLPRVKSFVISDIKKHMTLSKTTIMFIVATVAFVTCHVPYVGIKVASVTNPTIEETFSSTEIVFYRLAQYSFIVSYAVNPIIYSFLNSRFRIECRKLLRTLSIKFTCTCDLFWKFIRTTTR